MDNKKQMTEEELSAIARKQKQQYMREWYKNHPGKNKEYQHRYWLRCAGILDPYCRHSQSEGK